MLKRTSYLHTSLVANDMVTPGLALHQMIVIGLQKCKHNKTDI